MSYRLVWERSIKSRQCWLEAAQVMAWPRDTRKGSLHAGHTEIQSIFNVTICGRYENVHSQCLLTCRLCVSLLPAIQNRVVATAAADTVQILQLYTWKNVKKKLWEGKIYWRCTTTWSGSIHLWTLFTDFFCLEDKTSCIVVWERELFFTVPFLSHFFCCAETLCSCTPWPCLSLPGCSTSYTQESYCTVFKIAPPHTSQWGDVLLPVQKHRDSAHRPVVSQGKKASSIEEVNSAATFQSWTLWTDVDEHSHVGDKQTWVYDL